MINASHFAAKRSKPIGVKVAGRPFKSIKDAARYLDCAPSTVRKALTNGTLVAGKDVTRG